MNKIVSKIVAIATATMSLFTLSTSFGGERNNSLQASAASYETAYFPGGTLYVTQGAYNQYNAYSHGSQNAFDLGGNTNYVAPFTGKIVDIWSPYNVVTLQSTNKVYYADGTLDYMTVSFAHDNNISNLKEGMIIKQGTVFYQPGTKDPSGKTTGTHLHIAVKRGKVNKYFFSGNVYPNKAFKLKKDTKIVQTGGYGWTKSGDTSVTPSTCYPKYTGSSTSIVTALKSLGIDSSFSNRAKIAVANGIVKNTSQYTGSAAQNKSLLNLLKSGMLKKASASPVVTTKTYTIKSSSGAKVRSGAGTSYSSKGGLAKGSVVTYDQTKSANGYTWYHIVSVKSTSGSWGSFNGYWVAAV